MQHRKQRGRTCVLRRRRCSIQCYSLLLPAAAGYCYCPPPPPPPPPHPYPSPSRSFLTVCALLTFSLTRPSPSYSCSWLSSAPAAAVCPCGSTQQLAAVPVLVQFPQLSSPSRRPLASFLHRLLSFSSSFLPCACHVMSGLVCCRPWLLPCMRAQQEGK
eukprot:COSAG06_NODE_1832_length_8261_cov_31.690112_2_plen_159_part_00